MYVFPLIKSISPFNLLFETNSSKSQIKGQDVSTTKELHDFKNKSLLQDFEKLCDWQYSEKCMTEVRTEGQNESAKSEVFTFPMFTPSFCRELMREMRHFIAEHNIPSEQGMDGISMHQFKGVKPFVDWITHHVTRLASSVYTSDKVLYKLEPYYVNMVYYTYEGGGSLEHPVHVDDSHITVNVSISNNCSGGELYYYNSHTRVFEDVHHQVGSAVMHLGRLPHGARVLSAGERFNLIMWFRKADKFEYFSSLPLHIQQRALHCLSSPHDLLSFGSSCKQSLLMTNDDVVWASLYKLHFESSNDGGTKQKFVEKHQIQRTTRMKTTVLIWREIVDTEQMYVQSLQNLCDNHIKPLMEWNKTAKVVFQEWYILSTRILEQHKEMLKNAQLAISTYNYQILCGSFVTLFNSLQTYKMYMLKYKTILASIANKTFRKKIEELKLKDIKGLEINSYIIMPIRRIPRYALLLKELTKHTPEGLSKCQVLQLTNKADATLYQMNKDGNNN